MPRRPRPARRRTNASRRWRSRASDAGWASTGAPPDSTTQPTASSGVQPRGGHVGRPAVVQVALERLAAVGDVSRRDQRLGHVRPPDRAGGPGLDVGQRHRGAEPRQLGHHLRDPLAPARRQLGQAAGQRLGRGVPEVAQQVHRAVGHPHAQLDPRRHRHPEPRPRGQRPRARRPSCRGPSARAGRRPPTPPARPRRPGPGPRPTRSNGCGGRAGRRPAAYAETAAASPARPRASRAAMTRSALSPGSSSSVRTRTSAAPGAS